MHPVYANTGAVLIGLVAAASLGAQANPPRPVPKAVYARAQALDRPSAATLVKNVLVIPHGIGSSDAFWYRKETTAGGGRRPGPPQPLEIGIAAGPGPEVVGLDVAGGSRVVVRVVSPAKT